MRAAVSYIRVSKPKQGRSGLGLEAQQATIRAFCAQHGYSIEAEYREVETGKGADALERRPQLASALAAAKKRKCPIIIAKLDRLSRSVAFVSGLMAKGIPFICVEHPNAPPLMLHIFVAFAEEERNRIAQRTREALAAAKARGQKLGNSEIGRARKNEAHSNAEHLRPIIEPLRALTAKRISVILNERGITTPREGKWQATQVIRLLDRLGLRAKPLAT
jgi:DNA invertase Pin-like site-specific DNA recombinase